MGGAAPVEEDVLLETGQSFGAIHPVSHLRHRDDWGTVSTVGEGQAQVELTDLPFCKKGGRS